MARTALVIAAALWAGLVSMARPASGVPEDLPGWGAARWGMTAAELKAAFGDRLTALPGRWLYGGAYARQAILDLHLGDLAFTAYFQMSESEDRLQQVLLERRQQQALPDSFEKLRQHLEDLYGPPAEACLLSERDPTGLELVWRFPTTTVHATFLNFFSTSLLYFDPSLDIDPLRPSSEERILRRRTLPRRIALRYHPSSREDLMSRHALCYPSLADLREDLKPAPAGERRPRP